MQVLKKIMFVSFFLLLVGCTDGEQKNVNEEPKKEYVVTVENISGFSSGAVFQKYGKVRSSNEVIITSQVAGRVEKIAKNIGDSVSVGSIIMHLDDTANYGLQVSQSQVGVQSAVLQFETRGSTLDKQISDAELALQQAEENFATVKKATENAVRQATENYMQAKRNQTGGVIALELEKAQKEIAVQLTAIDSSLQVSQTNILTFLEKMLYEVDVLFGVSDKNRTMNDSFELFLSARDTQHKVKVIQLFSSGEEKIEKIRSFSGTREQKIEVLFSAVSFAETLGNEVLAACESSVSAATFSEQQIDAWRAKFNGFQSQKDTLLGSLSQVKSQADMLIGDVTPGTRLADRSIEIMEKKAEVQQTQAEIAYDQALVEQQNRVFTSELGVKQAKDTLDYLRKVKANELGSVQNQVKNAEILYEQTSDIYKNLFITAPIRGKIDAMFVDEGVQVQPGTPLCKIVREGMQEVPLSISYTDMQFFSKGKEVQVAVDGEMFSGVVSEIHITADAALSHTVVVRLASNVPSILGQIIRVIIPISIQKVLLPLQSIYLVDQEKGFIYILSGQTDYKKEFITVGKTRGDKIEVITSLPTDAKVILSPMDNFSTYEFSLKPVMLK